MADGTLLTILYPDKIVETGCTGLSEINLEQAVNSPRKLSGLSCGKFFYKYQV